ncbi:MAG TPA: hypothetical protein VLM05_01680 [Mycobacteriales bacterium]|nr:hypothetical protein [Mycobacteriales bacterium]
MSDEVSGGPAPSRGRVALVALVAVGLVAVAVTALRQGVTEPLAAPTPTRSPAASLPPTPSLAFGDVCRPVRATAPSALDVSFSLRNNGSRPVRLTAVTPELPMSGLQERGYTIRSGTCKTRGRTLSDNRLERVDPVEVQPAGWVVATLHFALPDECPSPYPVSVLVSEMQDAAASPIDTHYALLPDLAEVRFPSC